MTGWPGQWHSKVERDDDAGLTNDNGLLFMSGDEAEAYLWYEPDGHDALTEVSR